MTNAPSREPLPKTYDPSTVEERLYRWWESSGFFRAERDPAKKPFTIIMPPPNVTGELHLGHAARTAIEDALTRYHRMLGEAALWLPGTDHAGIATQMVVERALVAEGTSRIEIGREAFLKRTWEWVETYGSIIDNQHRRLGASCDWSRKVFTLDPGPSKAVRTTFKRLYDKGLIYRGERLVNWCVGCRTAISDLEVDHVDEEGSLYYIRYPLEDGSGHLVVATTRPETLLGDTAVAVNPTDERYAGMRGKRVLLPVLGRAVPIIEDPSVAADFGTGALKITPGHDPNDFEVGERHGLPVINIMNPDGTLNEAAGPYAGYDRFAARTAIVEQLEREGLLEKVEPHTHSVGHCQRSSDVIEPLVSEQWFVKVEPLAARALDAVTSGRIRIVPERFVKVYTNWMENIRDWCISRQLWWGHRIPVWYCEPHGHLTVAIEDPAACEQCGSNDIHQDEDVLDTWFSSGLWPHSTLGWPEKTEDLAYFYPTAVMETAYDILFFWIARMVMLGLENMDEVPFKTVYLAGLVRDAHGVKMSKTRGNVIDPIVAIETYGTDALRFALTTGTTPGNDTRLSESKLEAARNFANKLWNVERFVLASLGEPDPAAGDGDLAGWSGAALPRTHREDRWIVSRTERTAARVNELLGDWAIGEAERVLHDFVWGEFADWYIELAKVRLRAGDRDPRRVLAYVLESSLRMLHPFMPFVTEELWQHLMARLPKEGERPPSIMLAPYPLGEAAGDGDGGAVEEIEALIEVVRAIRNVRAEFKIEPGRLLDAVVSAPGRALADEAEAIRQLARVGTLAFTGDGPPQTPQTSRLTENAVRLVLPHATVTLDLGDAVDVDAERARLGNEAAEAEKYLNGLTARLGNEQFTGRAPAEVVERERERLEQGTARLERIRELLAELGA
ncbi:MAG: valine--tRNA ligase [Chloroflexi bacterium]|nr:valine--tRNA ligase [Chloroflexota bacterium]